MFHEPPPLTPYPPLIVNACLTGMVPTREHTPHVPLEPDEIVEDGLRVAEAGAQILHLHARGPDGKPTWSGEIYERILAPLRRARPDLVLCVSTSGRNWSDLEKRMEVLLLEGDAKPDMASLTLGSLNFRSGPSVNAMDDIRQLADTMTRRGIKPELEVFDLGMAAFGRHLLARGVLHEPLYFNLLLGSLGAAPADIGTLSAMVAALPPGAVWAGAGIGGFQLPVNTMAIAAGGHVRVGIEDNPYYDAGRTRPASNVDLVRRVVRIAAEFDRRPATPDEVRAKLGLLPPGATGPSSAGGPVR